MPNFIPYLFLVLISLTFLVTMMIRERQFGLVVLFFSFSGMVFIAEFFVLVIGDGYEYFPDVLNIRYYDNVLGANVSNLWTIPALATLVAVYRLRLRWIVLIATSLLGMDWLFVHLHIYEHHWWKTPYTWVVAIIFFYLTRFWLDQLEKGLGFFRFVGLWMQAWSVAGTVMFIMSVIGIRYYQFGWFADMHRDDIMAGSFTGLWKAGVFTIFVTCFRQVKWRLLAPLVVYALDLPLYLGGWLETSIPFGLYTMIYLGLAYLLLWWNSYAHQYLWKIGRTPTR